MKTLFQRFLMLLKSLVRLLCQHCMHADKSDKVNKASDFTEDSRRKDTHHDL